MTDTKYCYHCRCFHRSDEVLLVSTASGERWRCMKSLSLRRLSQTERDAFGKSVSELNRTNNLRQSGRPLPRPILELFGDAPSRVGGLA